MRVCLQASRIHSRSIWWAIELNARSGFSRAHCAIRRRFVHTSCEISGTSRVSRQRVPLSGGPLCYSLASLGSVSQLSIATISPLRLPSPFLPAPFPSPSVPQKKNFPKEVSGSPMSPGNPNAHLPCSIPRSDFPDWLRIGSVLPPLAPAAKAPTTCLFSRPTTRLLYSLSTLQAGVTPRLCKTRFRLVANLYRVGLITHWVALKGFYLYLSA